MVPELWHLSLEATTVRLYVLAHSKFGKEQASSLEGQGEVKPPGPVRVDR